MCVLYVHEMKGGSALDDLEVTMPDSHVCL